MTKTLVNEFSWSRSRMKAFEECRRRYWFSAYGMWEGWDPTGPERTREIYVLSKLKSRWMWAGEAVHGAAAETLEAYRAGAGAPAIDLRERMRDQWKSSRDKVYRRPRMAKTCALFEHEYEEETDDWKEVADHADRCWSNFLASGLHQELRALPREDWLGIEELDSFQIEGTKIHVKLDAVHRAEGGVRIIDWKTGRGEVETDPFQLAVYALYAGEAWKIPPGRVRVVEANLASNRSYERWVAEEEMGATRAKIVENIEAMKSLLRGSPEENVAVEGDYPVTDDPRRCRRCNFQRVCADRPR